jgi:hypothetical protein
MTDTAEEFWDTCFICYWAVKSTEYEGAQFMEEKPDDLKILTVCRFYVIAAIVRLSKAVGKEYDIDVNAELGHETGTSEQQPQQQESDVDQMEE